MKQIGCLFLRHRGEVKNKTHYHTEGKTTEMMRCLYEPQHDFKQFFQLDEDSL
jgi:hypothetical protein